MNGRQTSFRCVLLAQALLCGCVSNRFAERDDKPATSYSGIWANIKIDSKASLDEGQREVLLRTRLENESTWETPNSQRTGSDTLSLPPVKCRWGETNRLILVGVPVPGYDNPRLELHPGVIDPGKAGLSVYCSAIEIEGGVRVNTRIYENDGETEVTYESMVVLKKSGRVPVTEKK